MDTVNVCNYENHQLGGDGKGTGMVKPEDMSLLQERLFETLVYFDRFCEEHDIHYILAAGTCLGAVREKDFIPWDDDLDVAVLRSDFDKLFDLWDQYGDKENFSLYRTTQDFCAYVPIGLLRNNNTTYIRDFEEGLTDRNLGVKIDIEPLDEIPEDPKKRKKQKYFALMYVLFLTQRKPRHERKSKYMNIGAGLLLDVFRGKKIRNLIIRITEPQVKKYNGTGCAKISVNGVGRRLTFKKELFTELTRLPFHGKEFSVPEDYDGYLNTVYGNSRLFGKSYHDLPPVEKRKPQDTPAYYDLNTPYKEYLKEKTK
ncbi:MAG: LicD family protein [Clostridia bacterium]|nr:LicD family protein [Clostridia bacterium]